MEETTKQEARWLYAKGLELAILLKGPVDKQIIEAPVSDMLFSNYHELAIKIGLKIMYSSEAFLTPKEFLPKS
jgi:hypothetical protein